ncbi:uncharacterized protein LOC109977750 isoform X2 [Xyrichtys novacula]|uniref:Uncharacterized protein LOC109977750 isoform X2 n=1 Tax=Xyrichtys novacula TaxID=13765 RepID=A0AAV1H398_XYRNO|nr:uncharacterized protein LOC109977750 isoform X2 [Xyrichtys novacula]
MNAHLSALLIFTGLSGLQSLTTVSKVPVKIGGSITVPCLYESKYKNHVKYLCEGYYWNYCSYAVKTNQQKRPAEFSIFDDKQQGVFTVTIKSQKNLYYWCAVEIKNGNDTGVFFQLSVTKGPRLLDGPQKVSGFRGGNIIINFPYTSRGGVHWCRLGGSCVKEPSGSIAGADVTISAENPVGVKVTLSGLRTYSSGWYYFAKGDLKMPVHVTVKERPRATTQETTTTCLNISSSTLQPVTHTWTSAYEENTEAPGSFIHSLSLMIPLSLLLTVLLIVAITFWFIWRRHKETKARLSSATEVRVTDLIMQINVDY